MTERSLRRAYALGIGAAAACVAWAQSALLLRFLDRVPRRLSREGWAGWRALAEDALFWTMVLAAWALAAWRPSPRRDLAAAALALAAGWAVEAWGTRSGLWAYYTGERPPLWVLVAWVAGAIVVDRLSALGRAPRGGRAAYFALLGLAAAAIAGAAFRYGAMGLSALSAALPLALLAWRPEPARELRPLAVGMACVFFADLWGTASGCYRYAWQDGSAPALAGGIAFGMLLDAVVVAACLKLRRIIGL